MSWFSDIAGRAEDFLTKVDQKAASALQKPLLPNATKNSFMAYAKSPTTRAAPPSDFPTTPPPLSSTKFSSTPKPSSRGLSLAGSSSSPKPKRAQSEASDEKLLEFLNSSEPAPAAPKRSLSQSKLSPESPNDADDAGGVGDSSSRKELEAAPEACIAEEGTSVLSATDHDGPGSRRSSLQQEALQGAAAASGRSVAADTVESSLAEENKMLRKEVATLNQEIASALERAKNANAEKKHLQNRLDLWTSQVSSSDSALRELQARERDLTSALEAKDAQLAVLRVRLQEADQELGSKRRLVEDLRDENQRLARDQTDQSQVQGKTVDALRDKLAQAEQALRKEQEAHRLAQAESMQRQLKMEEEVASLSESLTLAQKQLADQKALARESSSQASSLRCSLDLARQELADYKQKAQRILQSKEKLIASLKDANTSGSALDGSDAGLSAASVAELEAMTQECEHLRSELRRVQNHADSLSVELHEQESSLRRELESLQEQQRDLLRDLKQERHQRQEVELEARQAAEEITFLKEELRRNKEGLQQRLSERECELEKLRKQIMTKSMSTTSEEELEARLHALTESLIQKQTLVEALSTEKNSLVLQLERLERQLKESQIHTPKPHTAIPGFGQSEESDDSGDPRARLPGIFAESPFDSTVTRKVKRAYGVIDSLSIRAGVFLRRYPLARIFILVYMGLMHFWVMIVLLTYEPEIHGPHSKQTAAAISKNA
ncbi:golgin subfamily A member 5-like isoform X1 [Haemaphysalis longicornis]